MGAIGCLIAITFWIISVILFPPYSNMRIICGNIATNGVSYFTCLLQTYWVIGQYVKQLKLHANSEELTHFKLEQVLCTKDGFDLFANHVVKEFSVENLFFVFEVMQMKHELISNKLVIKYLYYFVLNMNKTVMIWTEEFFVKYLLYTL